MIETNKNDDIFNCKSCDFKCRYPCDYERHIMTSKHKNKVELNNKTNKNTNLYCEFCDFVCGYKSLFTRHIMTPKHQYRMDLNKTNKGENKNEATNVKDNKTGQFICTKCQKSYTARNSLWYHTKRCTVAENHVETLKTNKTEPDVINMIMEVVKQNTEFKELILEQNKQIIELSSKPTTNNNTTNNTTNNSFNLQFFLNETCKDALNITEFISQLQVGIKDLEETGRLGYAHGISKIFINGLK